MKVVREGKSLPGKVMDLPSLQVFRIILNEMQTNLMWPHSSAFIQWEVGPETPWGSFQTELFSLTREMLSQEKWLVFFLVS